MPALIVLYALLGMPFDPAWLTPPPQEYELRNHCGEACLPKLEPKLDCRYVYLIPVYEGKDAPGEAQMFKVCEVSK